MYKILSMMNTMKMHLLLEIEQNCIDCVKVVVHQMTLVHCN